MIRFNRTNTKNKSNSFLLFIAIFAIIISAVDAL